eukprot:jgi/Botrbrau1/13294/Bobra.27_2s0014.1
MFAPSHTAAMLAEAGDLIGQQAGALGGRPPALLFCGDLNSDLNDGIPGTVELLRKGQIPASFWDWAYATFFSYRKDADEAAEEGLEAKPEAGDSNGTEASGSIPSGLPENGDTFPGLHLTIPFSLASADSLETDFTNYVRGYRGCLDYVWYEPEKMMVRRAIPLPAEEELNGWIPSPRFPSDHLAVVFDMEWLPPVARQDRALPSSSTATEGQGQDAQPQPVLASAAREQPASTSAGPALPLQAMRSEQRAHAEHAAAVQAGPAGHAVPDQAPSVGTVVPIQATVAAVAQAVAALSAGGVIAVPTDTLYGFAACANDGRAVSQIYGIKGRDLKVPLAICVGDPSDLQRYSAVAHLPAGLLEALLPGPVTLLLPRLPEAPLTPDLNPGIPVVGVRVPDQDFIREVCRRHGGAIALTSANPSGSPSCLAVSEFAHLWPHCAAVFDGGAIAGIRDGSTIVDLSQEGRFAIRRRGTACDRVVGLLTSTYGLQDASFHGEANA